MTVTDTDIAAGLDESNRAFLKALASESRQQLLLLFADGEAHTVGEIASLAGIGQSTASEQLAILRRAGLLSSSREGKKVCYRADRDRIAGQLDQLRVFLSDCCR
jgi:DNA-binding transcriptional ArsR family regulator